MTTPAAHPQRWTQRLGVRLAFALAVALLPLGVVSGLQSASLLQEAQARSEAALLGETLLAAAPETALIGGAQVAVAAIAATLSELRKNPAGCSAALRQLVAQSNGAFSYAVFVPPNGLAECTSNAKPFDLSKSLRLVEMRKDPKPDFVVIRDGKASGKSVLAFGYPVFDDLGGFVGYASISMPHSVLEDQPVTDTDTGKLDHPEPISLITFDNAGNILTSSTGLEDAPGRLPADWRAARLSTKGASTFAALSGYGKDRVYAVFPLVEDKIFCIGSWPVTAVGGPLSFWVSPYLMPLLMWSASFLVAMLAAEHLVNRHIRTLRRSIRSFAGGNRYIEGLDMPAAAVEIRDVADAYLTMTDTILQNEAELEDSIHQRDVLLREVHHRVKNNLQLIASIISMQLRQPHSADAKSLMKGLQDRVMSLATIHRGLYQTSGLADVSADELLTDILRQMLRMASGPGLGFDVKSHFDPIRMIPDQAVPLSLLLTEALTNAIKYAGSDSDELPRIEVTLRRDGPMDASLLVANSLGATTASPVNSSTGLGSQLMVAFAQQLGAKTEISTETGMYRLHSAFKLRSLAEAEERADHTPEPEAGPEAGPELAPDGEPAPPAR